MAAVKTRAEKKRSFFFGVAICVILVAAIVITFIAFNQNRSSLFVDQGFARAFAEAIGKSPSAVTEDDILSIKVLAITTQVNQQTGVKTTSLVVGGDDFLKAIEVDIEAEDYDESAHSEQYNSAQKTSIFTQTLKKLDDIAIFKNLSYLNLNEQTILKNLNVVQNLEKLETLMIGSTAVKSLKDITGLTSLKTLGVQSLGLNDISVLSPLKNLETLYLSSNSIDDLSTLAEFTKLEVLYFEGNELTSDEPVSSTAESDESSSDEVEKVPVSIKPLEDLTNLKELRLTSSAITDGDAISKLINLKKLSLADTGFNDLTPLKDLVNLTTLYVSNNKISDISALSALTKITELDIGTNEIEDISVLSGMKDLATVYLNKNKISDLTPLKDLTKMAYLYASENEITDVSMLTNFDATVIKVIYLSGNEITNGDVLKSKYTGAYVVFDPVSTSNTSDNSSETSDAESDDNSVDLSTDVSADESANESSEILDDESEAESE
ncbi:MAG: leucine-rich repeat domain-containing protein [Eubacteriales bacterium]|nr:leucine-rich repeat domain-containing protein [Eubacteriales bacterium]